MSSGSQRNPQFLIREAVLTADRWQVPNAPTPDQEQTTNDDAVIAREARAMLVWRMEHANRQNTGLLVEDGGVGRWPSGVQWRDNSPTN